MLNTVAIQYHFITKKTANKKAPLKVLYPILKKIVMPPKLPFLCHL